jgi:hypothetical protein
MVTPSRRFVGGIEDDYFGATVPDLSKSKLNTYDEIVRASRINVGTVTYRAPKGRTGMHSDDGLAATQAQE